MNTESSRGFDEVLQGLTNPLMLASLFVVVGGLGFWWGSRTAADDVRQMALALEGEIWTVAREVDNVSADLEVLTDTVSDLDAQGMDNWARERRLDDTERKVFELGRDVDRLQGSVYDFTLALDDMRGSVEDLQEDARRRSLDELLSPR